jgi:hypothetical protein
MNVKRLYFSSDRFNPHVKPARRAFESATERTIFAFAGSI